MFRACDDGQYPLNANLGKHVNYHLHIIKDQLYLVLVHYLPMADMKSLKFTTVVDAITMHSNLFNEVDLVQLC